MKQIVTDQNQELIIDKFIVSIKRFDRTLCVTLEYSGKRDVIREMFHNKWKLFREWIGIHSGYAKRTTCPPSKYPVDKYIRPYNEPHEVINLAFIWDYNLFVAPADYTFYTSEECHARAIKLSEIVSDLREIVNKINAQNINLDPKEILNRNLPIIEGCHVTLVDLVNNKCETIDPEE